MCGRTGQGLGNAVEEDGRDHTREFGHVTETEASHVSVLLEDTTTEDMIEASDQGV